MSINENTIVDILEQSINDFNRETNDKLYLYDLTHCIAGYSEQITEIHPIIKIKCKDDLKQHIDNIIVFKEYFYNEQTIKIYFDIEFYKDRSFEELSKFVNSINDRISQCYTIDGRLI